MPFPAHSGHPLAGLSVTLVGGAAAVGLLPAVLATARALSGAARLRPLLATAGLGDPAFWASHLLLHFLKALGAVAALAWLAATVFPSVAPSARPRRQGSQLQKNWR